MNGEQWEESVLNLQICLTKGYIFKRSKEELGGGGGGEHVRGISDFEESSMFNLILLGLYILVKIYH